MPIVLIFISLSAVATADTSFYEGDLLIIVGETTTTTTTTTIYYPTTTTQPKKAKRYCGNRICEYPESCNTCPIDCGRCYRLFPVCGNGICEFLESATCPSDCVEEEKPAEPVECGDWIESYCSEKKVVFTRMCDGTEQRQSSSVECCKDGDCGVGERCHHHLCLEMTEKYVGCENRQMVFEKDDGSKRYENVECCVDTDCPSLNCGNFICQQMQEACAPILQYSRFGSCHWSVAGILSVVAVVTALFLIVLFLLIRRGVFS